MALTRSTDILTINAAARHSGKSATTIRRWLDSGSLKHTLSPEGYKLINKSDLLVMLHEGNSSVVPHVELVQQLPQQESDMVRVLKEALEYERRRCERLENENKEIKGEYIKMSKEMQSILQKETGIFGWVRTKKS